MRLTIIHLQENSKLISGHVAEKKGYLYWVLNLTDENGKRKPKWIPTHKKVKGNKTWANNMLPTIRKEWTEKLLQEATASQQSASPSGPSSAAISFVDFLYQWLEYKYKSATGRVMDSKPIELSTYSGYEQQLNNPIAPYFREHPVALCDLTKQDILAFYEKELERVKPTTVKHYHALIHILYKNSFFLDASKRFDNSSPEFVELINGTIGMRKSKNFVRSSFEKISSLTA